MDRIQPGTAEVQKKVEELEEKLRKSEEERLKLQLKYESVVRAKGCGKTSKIDSIRGMYHRYAKEDTTRNGRNRNILEGMGKTMVRANMLTAKTDRLRILRHHYESYIESYYPRIKMIKSHHVPSLPVLYGKEMRYPASNADCVPSVLNPDHTRFAGGSLDQGKRMKDLKKELYEVDPGTDSKPIRGHQNVNFTDFNHVSAYSDLPFKNEGVGFYRDRNESKYRAEKFDQSPDTTWKSIGNQDYCGGIFPRASIKSLPQSLDERTSSINQAPDYLRADLTSVYTDEWKTPDKSNERRCPDKLNASISEKPNQDGYHIKDYTSSFNYDIPVYDTILSSNLDKTYSQDSRLYTENVNHVSPDEMEAVNCDLKGTYEGGHATSKTEVENVLPGYNCLNNSKNDEISSNEDLGPSLNSQLTAEPDERNISNRDRNIGGESVIEKDDGKLIKTGTDLELSINSYDDIPESVEDNDPSNSNSGVIQTDEREKQTPKIAGDCTNIGKDTKYLADTPDSPNFSPRERIDEDSIGNNKDEQSYERLSQNEILPTELIPTETNMASLPIEECIQFPKEQTLELYPEEITERFYRQNRAEEYAQEIPSNFLNENTAGDFPHRVVQLSDAEDNLELKTSHETFGMKNDAEDDAENNQRHLNDNIIQEYVESKTHEDMKNKSVSSSPKVVQSKEAEHSDNVDKPKENDTLLGVNSPGISNDVSFISTEKLLPDDKDSKEGMSTCQEVEKENYQIKNNYETGDHPVENLETEHVIDEKHPTPDSKKTNLSGNENLQLDDTAKCLQNLELNEGISASVNEQYENYDADLNASSNFIDVNYNGNQNSSGMDNQVKDQRPSPNMFDDGVANTNRNLDYQDVQESNFNENEYTYEQSYTTNQDVPNNAQFETNGIQQNPYPETITDMRYYDENYGYEDNAQNQQYNQPDYKYDDDYTQQDLPKTEYDHYSEVDEKVYAEMTPHEISNQQFTPNNNQAYEDNPDEVMYNVEEYNYGEHYQVPPNVPDVDYQHSHPGKEEIYNENTVNHQYSNPGPYGYDENTAESHYDQHAYSYKDQNPDEAYYPENVPKGLENQQFSDSYSYDESLQNPPYQDQYDYNNKITPQEYLPEDSYNYSETEMNPPESVGYENNFEKSPGSSNVVYSEKNNIQYSDQIYPTDDLPNQGHIQTTQNEIPEFHGTNLSTNDASNAEPGALSGGTLKPNVSDEPNKNIEYEESVKLT